jgi:cholesterol 7-dehydrogenase
MNGFIYVWIHSLPEHQDKPIYPMIDVHETTKNLEYRGRIIHDIYSHIQDIPENGSDIYHFKYVHKQIIPHVDLIQFIWEAKWMRGDDPDLKSMFEHNDKTMREYKQKLYRDYIEPYPEKKYISIGYLDNYIKVPILGRIFLLNATIFQIGPGCVFIFVKSHYWQIVFKQFLQPRDKAHQYIVHDAITSKWLPYWATAAAAWMESTQVTNDMYIWNGKKFGRKIQLRENEEADVYIREWRKWFSQHYEGCLEKEKNRVSW